MTNIKMIRRFHLKRKMLGKLVVLALICHYTECRPLVKGANVKNKQDKHIKTTPIPFLTKLKDINRFSADMMHGDYVGAGLDGIDFLETFQNLKWPVRFVLKLVDRLLKLIHPVYLVIFPRARNNGTFVDNLMFSVQHGGGMIKGVMRMVSMFQ
ncbi:uncharacterized protein LOC126746746 [Anthonomus grandis grandis]|uniref:uncharacterized protein LOC126746746 n=1 Tax=Anthonomus grandis grandis TaxID=2921223 RepID=UPI002165F1F5|nr:uncharacterized protein LOC126746746 [Anthonomus grandis grandis]